MSNYNFLQLPEVLLSCESFNGVKLSIFDKLYLSVVISYHREGKQIFPSLEYLAKKFSTSVSTMKRARKTLISARLISVTRRYNNSSLHTFESSLDEIANVVSKSQPTKTVKPNKGYIPSYPDDEEKESDPDEMMSYEEED